jgi:hypothetical protein
MTVCLATAQIGETISITLTIPLEDEETAQDLTWPDQQLRIGRLIVGVACPIIGQGW